MVEGTSSHLVVCFIGTGSGVERLVNVRVVEVLL